MIFGDIIICNFTKRTQEWEKLDVKGDEHLRFEGSKKYTEGRTVPWKKEIGVVGG